MAGSHSEPSSPKTEEERRAARAKARADALARAAEAEKLTNAAAKERAAAAEKLEPEVLLLGEEATQLLVRQRHGQSLRRIRECATC